MSERLAVRCPAKINLALRVLSKRPDGYHELDTVFQAITLWDLLEGQGSDRLTLECDLPALAGPANLALRAAERLRDHVGDPSLGARLRLTKRIPVQAGLGGGSADAAGALRLCARLWEVDIEELTLTELGAELGADVPFFLQGGTARGTGRGDRIEALPELSECHVLLGIPPFGISTAEIFGALSGRLTLYGNGVTLPVLLAHKWPVDKDFRFMVNDLEKVVLERWPALRSFRHALVRAGADAGLLSGSGSTVYGIFSAQSQLERAREMLADEFADWKLVETRTHPGGVEWIEAEGAT